jgi:hypothetical protein
MALSDLPRDELLRYAQALGLHVAEKTPDGELLRLVRERQELLDSLDRGVLVELIKWTRRAVHENASKEELAREIAQSRKMTFDGLSQPALYALARLRSVECPPTEDADALSRRLRKAESWGEMFRRKRNAWLGGLIGRYVLGQSEPAETDQEYKFLPPDQRPPTFQEEVEDRGLIGSLTGRIKGAADDYVREKLDEIEKRIDRKLDEIDRRLSEWRDRELVNRLRIIKITLAASVLVAMLSLGYHLFKNVLGGAGAGEAPKDAPALKDAAGSDGAGKTGGGG